MSLAWLAGRANTMTSFLREQGSRPAMQNPHSLPEQLLTRALADRGNRPVDDRNRTRSDRRAVSPVRALRSRGPLLPINLGAAFGLTELGRVLVGRFRVEPGL